MLKVGTHASAGRGADDARTGVRRVCRLHRARRRRRRTRSQGSCDELNLGATAVGTGLNAGEDYASLAIRNLSRYTGLPLKPAANRFRVTQSMGDVARLLGRHAATGGGTGKGRERSASPQHGTACRHQRDQPAGGAAGLVDHARQGQSVGAGNGQSGLLPGDGLRRDGAAPAKRGSSSST